MSIDRYTNGSYVNVGYGRLESGTDTITTLPKTLYADGQSASAVIKGNMSQSGTPTPASPIYPTETGDKTANLFDKSNPQIYLGYYKAATNQLTPYPANAYIYISVEPNTTYYISGIKRYDNTSTTRWCTTATTFTDGSTVIQTDVIQPNSNTTIITTGTNERFLGLFMCADVDYQGYGSVNAAIAANCADLVIDNGYKIPISSGGTTTNVYLGEVQSERQIYEVILTGQETGWQGAEASGGRNRFVLNLSGAINADTTNPYSLCSHLPLGERGATYSTDNVYTIASGKLYMRLTTDYDTLITFKTYLAQQYTNGTPVTVWYVLATPTTTTLNEPIRKIGTYTDSVSVTGIPTTGTEESFDVDTSLKPSEVSLTYHGWHEHSDTKF